MAEVQKTDIVMFNMSDYSDWNDNGIVNRNYFVLQKLLKSKHIEKILAVDLLPHNYKRAIKKYFTNNYCKCSYDITKSNNFSKLIEINKELYIYNTVESICIRGENKIYDKINKITETLNFKNTVLWSYVPTYVRYFDKINAEIKVFDAVDNWSEHNSYQKIKDRLIKNYKIIDDKADVIFTVSNELKEVFKNNKNVYWIPNGVDSKHFDVQKEGIVPKDIEGIKKPIVGYVGIVQDRFDVDMMEYLLKNNPDKSFVIVGMVWPDAGLKRLSSYKNLYLLGQKKYQELPGYIKEFDVAIIPHKINEFTKSMNPMKLYEYLASGKPIVTTKIAGSEKFEEFIKIAVGNKDFNDQLNNSLSEDSDELSKMRKRIAQENSWDKRVSKMLDIIINN